MKIIKSLKSFFQEIYNLLSQVTNNIYLDNSRTDTYTADGTESRPFKTFTALSTYLNTLSPTASSTYKVIVKQGLPYTGDLTISKPFITFIGQTADKYVGYTGTITIASGVTSVSVQGIHLKNCTFIFTTNAVFLLEFKNCRVTGGTYTITSTHGGGEYIQVTGGESLWQSCTVNVNGVLGTIGLISGIYQGVTLNSTNCILAMGSATTDAVIIHANTGTIAEFGGGLIERSTLYLESGATVYADDNFLGSEDALTKNTLIDNGGALVLRSRAKNIGLTDVGDYFASADIETAMQEIGLTLAGSFNTIYLNPLNTGVADGTIFHPFPTMAEALDKISSDELANVTIVMGTGVYSYTGDITLDIPICIHGNGSTLAVSGTTTINSVHQIYDLATTGAIVYAYAGSSRSTRNGGSINGTVTIQGGFPHFENLNYTGAMVITAGNPYFRGLTGGGRITLNGADAVLSIADCNMDMTLEQANITVTDGQLIVNGGLFTNSGTVPNIVFNNTNLTDLTKAHMLAGVVTNTGITCGNALTIVGPTCITAMTGNVVFPTPMIPAFGVGGGTAQVQTAAVPIFATAYFAGLRFSVLLAATNSDIDPTMNLNGLGAKTVKSSSGGSIVVGDMVANSIADFIYDGTYLRLLNPQ
jgi:hypothetical protein